MEKICVILTGGTICSLPDANGKNQSAAAKTGTVLTEYYGKERLSPFHAAVEFDIRALSPDILSENMTVGVLGEILQIFKSLPMEQYLGVIVLHGTDTLAYTSAFLSFALAGVPIPVCMVSAQLRLGETVNGAWVREEKTNGYANFRAAVELIVNGIAPNVYAVYRNEKNEENGLHEPGELLVHYGAHLLQCPSGSNNFHSKTQTHPKCITSATLKGRAFETNACLYKNVEEIEDRVLLLSPHTGLNYERICLDGIRAVVHGTYHSQSVCIGRPVSCENRVDLALDEIRESDRPYSILSLLFRCKERGIPVFLAPCSAETALYGTTHNAVFCGAHPLGSLTLEAAYAKAILACALHLEGNALVRFMQKSLNNEA